MCIGIPMQVLESHAHHAICDDQGLPLEVDTRLVGQPATGQWLLVFLGAAREILEPEQALAIQAAVHAVQNIMSGNTQVDELFSDLIEREPPVPDHLKHLIGD